MQQIRAPYDIINGWETGKNIDNQNPHLSLTGAPDECHEELRSTDFMTAARRD